MNTIPQTQAAHFCRLFISDETGIYPLGYHARRILASDDSLTAEQQFTSFVFYQDNWQSLRLFPHQAADGTVVWYAPSEELPATIGAEHQKYIREVFPRLISEAEAGNWVTVDAYIDKMLQYQCTFGSAPKESAPLQPIAVASLFALVILLSFLKKI